MLQIAFNIQHYILFSELFTVTSLVHYLFWGLVHSMLLSNIMPLNNIFIIFLGVNISNFTLHFLTIRTMLQSWNFFLFVMKTYNFWHLFPISVKTGYIIVMIANLPKHWDLCSISIKGFLGLYSVPFYLMIQAARSGPLWSSWKRWLSFT